MLRDAVAAAAPDGVADSPAALPRRRRAAAAAAAAAAPDGAPNSGPASRRRTVLMFDVMDTIVHDPFFNTMPGARTGERAAQQAPADARTLVCAIMNHRCRLSLPRLSRQRSSA
jgi:hypothetical protein